MLTSIGIGAAAVPLVVGSAAAARSSSPALPDIEIYHIEGRRSERVIWLMEELGLPYKLIFTNNDAFASMAAIRSVNPIVPMAPTIFYGREMLVESGGIVELMINRHGGGRLKPELDSADYPAYLMWMHFSEGTLAARVFADSSAWEKAVPTERSFLVDTVACLQFAEKFLAAHPWFGGASFSGADVMMQWSIAMAFRRNVVDASEFPMTKAWLDKAEARPAYRRMLAKARPNGLISMPPPLKAHPPSDRRAPFPTAMPK